MKKNERLKNREKKVNNRKVEVNERVAEGMKSSVRVILHVDLNSFFASVEQSLHPAWKGKPLAVAKDPSSPKSVIVTCSYEARARGIYTTMLVGEARKKARDLIVVRSRHDIYRSVSRQFFDVLRSFTPLVEPVSIDEAYVDITEIGGLHEAVLIAERMQQALLDTLDLPCSIGIAPNRFLAKTASDLKKPLGITILRKRDVESVLWPWPVIEMYGVGKSTERKLRALGIETIGQLATFDERVLVASLGRVGAKLHARANGNDSNVVDPEAAEDRKSVGSSTTSWSPIDDRMRLLQTLERLVENVSKRLRTLGRVGYTVTVQIRYADRTQTTKSETLAQPIGDRDTLYERSVALFDESWTTEPVRLLGVTVSELVLKEEAVEQLTFSTYERYAKEEEAKRKRAQRRALKEEGS